jgi:pimeloyl-ACP methyl ester carboxylesterase
MTQLAPHPAERRTLDLPSGPLAVLDARPAGPPRATALLVPGYTGSKEDFAPILGGLTAAGYRCVAIDQPGQYESPGPDQHADYNVTRLGDVVLAAAAQISSEPVHLLGHSFGGLVSRAAAIHAPDRLRSLVLLASGPAGLGGPRAERMRRLEPVLAAGGMPAVHDALEELSRADPAAAAVPAPVRAFLRERFLASSAAGLKGMGNALEHEPDRVAELRATGVPVLVAYGEADDAWTPAEQADMAQRLGAQVEVLAGAAHSPAIEATDATVEILTRFWAAVEGTRSAVSP